MDIQLRRSELETRAIVYVTYNLLVTMFVRHFESHCVSAVYDLCDPASKHRREC